MVDHSTSPYASYYRCIECSYCSPFYFALKNHQKRNHDRIKSEKNDCSQSVLTEPYTCVLQCGLETNSRVFALEGSNDYCHKCLDFWKLPLFGEQEPQGNIPISGAEDTVAFNFSCLRCSFSTNSYLRYLKHELECCAPSPIKISSDTSIGFDEQDEEVEEEVYARPRVNLAHRCSLCPFIGDFVELLKHSVVNHAELRLGHSFQCNFCDFSTLKEEEFSRHLESHNISLEAASSPDDIEDTFVFDKRHGSPHQAMEPLEEVLSPSDPLTCALYSYKAKALRRHQQYHQTFKKCPKCDYFAMKIHNVKNHLKIYHECVHERQCLKCDFWR